MLGSAQLFKRHVQAAVDLLAGLIHVEGLSINNPSIDSLSSEVVSHYTPSN